MFNWLNANTLRGVLRALLAFGGGILVGKGKITQDQLASLTTQLTDPAFIGTCMAVMTGVWSVIHKQTVPVATTTTVVTPAIVATK